MSFPADSNLDPPEPKRRRIKAAKSNNKNEPDFADAYNMDPANPESRLEEIKADFAARRSNLMTTFKAEQRKLSDSLLKALETQLRVQSNADKHSVFVLAEATRARLDAEERIQAHVDSTQTRFDRLEALLRVVIEGRIAEAEAALLEAGEVKGTGVKAE
ncbi:hypothetical protein ACHAQA_002371 [Verticillium albo-atrum]